VVTADCATGCHPLVIGSERQLRCTQEFNALTHRNNIFESCVFFCMRLSLVRAAGACVRPAPKESCTAVVHILLLSIGTGTLLRCQTRTCSSDEQQRVESSRRVQCCAMQCMCERANTCSGLKFLACWHLIDPCPSLYHPNHSKMSFLVVVASPSAIQRSDQSCRLVAVSPCSLLQTQRIAYRVKHSQSSCSTQQSQVLDSDRNRSGGRSPSETAAGQAYFAGEYLFWSAPESLLQPCPRRNPRR
jgi:hypothetical protein